MYMKYLNDKEKIIFLEIVSKVALANGNIDESEQTFLDHYAEQLNVEDINNIEFRNLTLEEAVSEIGSEESKRAIFIECVAMAYADEIYHEEQKGIILELRNAFGFSFEFYHDVKNWVIKVNELYNKGMKLVEPD